MAYVYRHIRLDKNEPFYIGIGSDKSYRRAFEKKRRSGIWNKIICKTSYDVEILIDNLSWEQACSKEKEFILLYGRKDLNSGTLVNLTDGGEGALNRKYKTSEETKLKLSKAHIGKKVTDDIKLKMSITRKGKKFSDSHIESLKKSAKNRDYKEQGRKCANKILQSMNVKPFLLYRNGELVGEFINRTECRSKIGISKTMFFYIIKDENKSCKGYQIKKK